MSKSTTKAKELPVVKADTPSLFDVLDADGQLVEVGGFSFRALDEELVVPSQRGSDAPAQSDLFVILETLHDWPIKDDVSSMEFPIFSLSKKPDTSVRSYSRGGKSIRVIPSALGAATVFDKDLLIYCISQIVRANDAGAPVRRKIRISVYPFLVGTKRSTGGAAYERVLEMCRRLKGTTLETNVKTNTQEQTEGFGLLEEYKVTQYTSNGRGVLEVDLTISDWLYRAAIASDILTLHPDYFKLSQALERRLYELGRKHCGQQAWWIINLPLLQDKTGSTQDARFFKQDLKAVIKLNRLPDYKLYLDKSAKPNQLIFVTRDSKKLMAEAVKQSKLDWLQWLLQQRIGD